MTYKQIKITLILSLAMIVLCVSMLAGTTLAWLTDSVESATSTVSAGALDVEVYYKTELAGEWLKLDAEASPFGTTEWSPGDINKVYLKIVNGGEIAVDYEVSLAYNEAGSENIAGEAFKLSDYIDAGAYFCATEAQLQTYEINNYKPLSGILPGEDIASGLIIGAGTSGYGVIVLNMDASDIEPNETNYAEDADVPKISLGITVTAKQAASEADDFGADFDAEAGTSADTEFVSEE